MVIKVYPKGIHLRSGEENINVLVEVPKHKIGQAFKLLRKNATIDHWTDFICDYNYKFVKGE